MALPRLAEPTPLEIDESEEAGVTVIGARGDLDLSSAAALCLAVQQCARPAASPMIALDLRAVRFCDSTGLRALMGAVREIEARAGRVVIIVAEGGGVERTLALAGVREFLHITTSPAAAKRRLGAVA